MPTDNDLRLRLGYMERRIAELEEKLELLHNQEKKTHKLLAELSKAIDPPTTPPYRRGSPYDASRGKPL